MISYIKYKGFVNLVVFYRCLHKNVSSSMNFLSFSIIFDVLETLDQRAFNALFRVPNNVLSEKVPPLYEKGQKTLQNSQNPGF